jgi:hypothetical protein
MTDLSKRGLVRVEKRTDGWAIVDESTLEVIKVYSDEGIAQNVTRNLNADKAMNATYTNYERPPVMPTDVAKGDLRGRCVCQRGAFLPGDEDLVCPIHGKVYG